MKEFIILIQSDVKDRTLADDAQRWGNYLKELDAKGIFIAGSAVGTGIRLKKSLPSTTSELALEGLLHIRAESIEEAKKLLEGNPHYEAGGSVDILELPKV